MANSKVAANHKGPVVVSVINLKGGVGKTTVATLLARHAARAGLNVLAVDLDPQANMSQALMEGYYDKIVGKHEPTVVELFRGLGYLPPSGERAAPAPLAQIARSVKNMGNFHVIPSRFDFADALVASAKFDEHALARFIAQEMQGKDLILIDCAPTDSVLSRAAYRASRYVLVPVREDFFSTIGFPLLKESLVDFEENNPNRKGNIEVCGVLINKYYYKSTEDSGKARGHIGKEAQENGWSVMTNVLGYSHSIPKMMREEHPSNVHGPTWDNIEKVAEEFLARVGLPLRTKQ